MLMVRLKLRLSKERGVQTPHTTAAPLTSPASILLGSNARRHFANLWLSHAVPRKLDEVVVALPEARLRQVVVIARH